MNAANKLTSACAARSPVEGQHTLRELPLCGKLNIRGKASNDGFVKAVKLGTDLTLPVQPNTMTAQAARKLFWLGPDEWLLHCELDQCGTISAALREHCDALHVSITEVSDYYTVLQLSGPQSEALIRKGTPLDIHHTVFDVGSFAQTRFGHASILLHKLDNAQTWTIQVRWTYAEYVWDYLVSGMAALQIA